jgi:hypothetical protein
MCFATDWLMRKMCLGATNSTLRTSSLRPMSICLPIRTVCSSDPIRAGNTVAFQNLYSAMRVSNCSQPCASSLLSRTACTLAYRKPTSNSTTHTQPMYADNTDCSRPFDERDNAALRAAMGTALLVVTATATQGRRG